MRSDTKKGKKQTLRDQSRWDGTERISAVQVRTNMHTHQLLPRLQALHVVNITTISGLVATEILLIGYCHHLTPEVLK
jgi:hypothetical protein